MTQNQWLQRVVKPTLFAACLVPLALLLGNALHNNLGANPIEEITKRTGIWTLRFLFITLAVTPLRRLSGWGWLIRFRRMLGLFAFFYATLHLISYVGLDQFFDMKEITKDVIKRPFITAGFTSFVLLVPLAVTSTNKMIKRLGKRWQPLHRLVYAIAMGGVIHYLWLVKADRQKPLIYAGVLAILLGYRLWMGYARSIHPPLSGLRLNNSKT